MAIILGIPRSIHNIILRLRRDRKFRNFILNILRRLAVTFVALFLIRLGTFFPVPYVDSRELFVYFENHPGAQNVISLFSGKDSFVINLFALNIYPYINASLMSQLLVQLSPELSEMQKENDTQSRRSINQLTRFITIIIAFIQSTALSLFLKQVLFNWNYGLALEIILWLTAGSLIVLWLSELITDYGLGNGSSLLITINIISNLPNFIQRIIAENNENLPITSKIYIGLLIFASVCGIIVLQESQVEIPLISANKINQKFQGEYDVEEDNYLPVPLNQASAMPIILAASVLTIPNYIIQLGLFENIKFLSIFKFPMVENICNVIYWIIYYLLILSGSLYYSNRSLNPKDISEQLQKSNIIVRGIRPGIKTTYYLQQRINNITLLGSNMLATVTVLPNFLIAKLTHSMSNELGTTSLFILLAFVLDLKREIIELYYLETDSEYINPL